MKPLRAGVILFALVGLGACHAPSPGARASTNDVAPSAKEEKKKDPELVLENAIGTIVEEILATSASEYGDRALGDYVAKIGGRIAQRSERKDIVWHFRVTDTPDIGAHALPGGRIAITRGLLAYLGSEAEVAAVLAHEIAHVSFRHSHSKWSPSVPVAEVGDGADARERARDADQERQADTVGARYLAEAGYDPHAMVTALAALERGANATPHASTDSSGTDDFDPHPAPPARIARAAVAAGAGKGEWGTEPYLARLAGIEWGESSSTPVFTGSRFIARGELSFAVPRGYKAKAEHGVLDAKPPNAKSGAKNDAEKSPDGELVAFRTKKSFLSEALRKTAMKGTWTTTTVAGWSALIERAPKNVKSAKDAKDGKASSDKSLTAILDGPKTPDGKETVIMIFVSGKTAASERVLDAFLASAERDTTAATPSAVLAIERADSAIRFDELVRRRCPTTTLDMATALNGRTSTEMLAPNALVKCVKAP